MNESYARRADASSGIKITIFLLIAAILGPFSTLMGGTIRQGLYFFRGFCVKLGRNLHILKPSCGRAWGTSAFLQAGSIGSLCAGPAAGREMN